MRSRCGIKGLFPYMAHELMEKERKGRGANFWHVCGGKGGG